MNKRISLIFLKDYEFHQKELLSWHWHLQNNRKWAEKRALLRRCATLEEIFLEPAFYELCELLEPKLEKTYIEKNKKEGSKAIATIAGLLAKIPRNNYEESFASQLRQSVSEFRFKQLVKSHDWEEFYKNLRRIIPIVGEEMNVISLCDNILQWGRDSIQEQRIFNPKYEKSIKVKWAMDYYQSKVDSTK